MKRYPFLFASILAFAFASQGFATLNDSTRLPEGIGVDQERDIEYKLPPFKAETVGDGVKLLSELPTNAVFQHGFDKLHERGITGKGVIWGIVDSGVEAEHSDVKGNLLGQSDSTNDRGRLLNAHGLHVYTTILGLKNSTGMYGCMPDGKGYDLKCLGGPDGSGIGRWIAAEIDKGAKLKCDVLNLSLGGPYDPLIVAAIDRFYVTNPQGIVCVASGNDGSNSQVNWPGKHRPVFTVASVGAENLRSRYSNAGPEVDGAAVGENVLGAWQNNRMARISGTSMATPAMAAAAGAYIQRCRELSRKPSQAEFEELFKLSSLRNTKEPSRTDALGWGVLRADKLIEALDDKHTKEQPTKPPTGPKSLVLTLADLSPAKQAELKLAGVTKFSLEIGHDGVAPKNVPGLTVYPVTQPQLAPVNVAPEIRSTPWPGVPFGPAGVPVPTAVAAPVVSSGCSGGVCPTQSTRSIPWIPRLFK